MKLNKLLASGHSIFSRYRLAHIAGVLVIIFSLMILLLIPPGFSQPPFRVIVISKTNDMEIAFWWSVYDGIQTAEREFDVSCEYWAPDTESEIEVQVSLITRAINEKPDAIVLAAIDYEQMLPQAQAITEAGIPLITMDSNVTGGLEKSFVATDNVQAGYKAGEIMESLLPEGEPIAVLSPLLGTHSSRHRDEGARHALSEQRTVKPTFDSDGLADNAQRYVEDLLASGFSGGILCLNEYTTVGAARAILDAQAQDDVLLVGFDSSMELIGYLESGLLAATIIQRPFNMGYLSIVTALDVIGGNQPESFVDTGSIRITKDNMYSEENEKLLFLPSYLCRWRSFQKLFATTHPTHI